MNNLYQLQNAGGRRDDGKTNIPEFAAIFTKF